MELNDIMTKQVEIIAPDATLQEAAEKMRDLDLGSLPVCDGRRVQGMLTDRDIVIRSTAAAEDPAEVQVQSVMSHDVAYVFADQNVEDAAAIMEEKQLRRLLVLDRNKDLVGILSLGDLSREVGDDALAGEVLKGISARGSSAAEIQL